VTRRYLTINTAQAHNLTLLKLLADHDNELRAKLRNRLNKLSNTLNDDVTAQSHQKKVTKN